MMLLSSLVKLNHNLLSGSYCESGLVLNAFHTLPYLILTYEVGAIIISILQMAKLSPMCSFHLQAKEEPEISLGLLTFKAEDDFQGACLPL